MKKWFKKNLSVFITVVFIFNVFSGLFNVQHVFAEALPNFLLKEDFETYENTSEVKSAGWTINTNSTPTISIDKDSKGKNLKFEIMNVNSQLEKTFSSEVRENFVMDFQVKFGDLLLDRILQFNSSTIGGQGQAVIFTKDGAIKFFGIDSGKRFNANEWVTISLFVDKENGVFDGYVNGEKTVAGGSLPSGYAYLKYFKFQADGRNSSNASTYYLDNIRIYSGNEILPTEDKNDEGGNIPPTDGESSDMKEKVYLLEDFNSYNGGINKAPSGWSIFSSSPSKVISPEAIEKGISVKYEFTNEIGELTLSKDLNEAAVGKVVLDFNFRLEDTNVFRAFGIKDSSGAMAEIFSISTSAALKLGGVAVNKEVSLGQWHNAVVVLDLRDASNKVFDAYLDGEKLLTGNAFTGKSANVKSFKFYGKVFGTAPATSKFYLDDVRVYEGSASKTLEELKELNKPTLPEDFDNALNIDISDRLKDSIAMVIGNSNALVNNQKKTIDQTKDIKPVYKNKEILVPFKFTVEGFGGTVTQNGGSFKTVFNGKNIEVNTSSINVDGSSIDLKESELINGEILIPMGQLAEVLGKKAYTDYRGRGLIVIGNMDKPFNDVLDVPDALVQPKDSEKFKIEEAIKRIVYERPSGDKIVEDLINKNNNVHPRIIATKNDFDRIKALISSGDPYMTKWFGDISAQAEKNLVLPLPTNALPDGRRMISSRQVGPLVINLGMMYRLTGEERYKDRIWKEVEAVSKFPDWNEDKEFLNTAEFSEGLAIAYDWLYEFWTPEERVIIRDAIIEKGLKKTLEAYRRNVWWIKTYPRVNNWNAVCNGSMGIAALAIADENVNVTMSDSENLSMKAFASKILKTGFNALEDFILLEFAPDGAWTEGPGYWKYTVEYLVKYMAALESSLGTSYGHDETPGLNRTAYFPNYLTGAVGSLNYGDAESNKIKSSEVLWIANKAADKALFTIHLNNKDKNKFAGSEFEMLWYKAENYIGEAKIELDKYFRNTEVATFRSAWDDANAQFVGFKGGSNVVSHGHYDLGSFVLESMGQQWAIDIGKDDYNLPGYSNYETNRLDYYRLNPEGHNTLVFNPEESNYASSDWRDKAQQNIKAFAKIINYESKSKGAFAIADLTEAYNKDVFEAKRGIMLTDNRTRAIVQDEIKAKKPSTIWWFMHTKADIKINEDGKSAILSKGGRRLWVGLDSDVDASFSVMDAKPLPTSPNPEKQNKNDGIRKLAVQFKNVQDVKFAVNFVPLLDGEMEPASKINRVDLKDWSIPEGELKLPKLESIKINGKKLEEFNKEKLTYNISLPLDTQSVPEVSAVGEDGTEITVLNAEDIPGVTRVIVKYPSDLISRNIYYINFKLIPEDESKLNLVQHTILGVTASASQADKGNTPEKSIDDDLNTLWASEGDQWINYDLGESKELNKVAILFSKGNERIFKLDIEVSEDNETWKRVFTGESSGESLTHENFYFKTTKARYLRINGHGNSVNQWNSYLDVEVWGNEVLEKQIIGVTTPAAITVIQGLQPVLPNTVTVEYNNNTTGSAIIVWGDVDTSTEGDKTVTGYVEGYAKPVIMIVKVTASQIIEVTSPAAIQVTEGLVPILPTTVIAKYNNNTTGSAIVVWEQVDTTTVGDRTVTGTVAGYTGTVSIIVKVVPAEIVSIDDIAPINIVQGTQVTLPNMVIANFNNRTKKSVPVVWKTAVDINKVGQQIIKGEVNGYQNDVSITVVVQKNTEPDIDTGNNSGEETTNTEPPVVVPPVTEITTADKSKLNEILKDKNTKSLEVTIKADVPIVDGSIFNIIKGVDKAVTFTNKSEDGSVISSWSFNGNTINKDIKDLDLTIKFTSLNSEEIKAAAKTDRIFIVDFNHHGDLPGEAKVKVKINNSWLIGKDKNNLSLYYYNADTKKMELKAEQLKVDASGYIEFAISHCSEYVIVDKIAAEVINTNNAVLAVETALVQKTFYHYNVAYDMVMKLNNNKQKEELLAKLAGVGSIVWSEDIRNINNLLVEMVKTASGKIYDEIQVSINEANIDEVDKAYLLGEVTSWGKKLVWTSDYSQAIDLLMKAWDKKDEDSVSKAKIAIQQIKNEYSKKYLQEELTKIIIN